MTQPLSFMVPLTMAMATWMGCHAQTDAPAKAQASIDSAKASSWCGVLSPDAYNVLREQGTEPRFSGEFWLHDKMGCTSAWDVEPPSLIQAPNSKAAVDGPVFFSPARGRPSTSTWTTAMACTGWRWYAMRAMGILGTSLKMARHRRACAIASTVWPWTLSPETACRSDSQL